MNTAAPLESCDHALALIPGPQPRRLGVVTGHGSADLAPDGLSASETTGSRTGTPQAPATRAANHRVRRDTTAIISLPPGAPGRPRPGSPSPRTASRCAFVGSGPPHRGDRSLAP